MQTLRELVGVAAVATPYETLAAFEDWLRPRLWHFELMGFQKYVIEYKARTKDGDEIVRVAWLKWGIYQGKHCLFIRTSYAVQCDEDQSPDGLFDEGDFLGGVEDFPLSSLEHFAATVDWLPEEMVSTALNAAEDLKFFADKMLQAALDMMPSLKAHVE